MTQVYDWAADENTMSEEKSFMPPTHNDNSIFHGSGVPFSDWEETREEATTWQDGYHYGYNDGMMTEPTRAEPELKAWHVLAILGLTFFVALAVILMLGQLAVYSTSDDGSGAVIEQLDHSYIAPESMLDSGHTN